VRQDVAHAGVGVVVFSDLVMTVHFGLAEWVRVFAGQQDSLNAMVAGRCRVEGDLAVAVRLEAMFGAR
jgi:putative sterol carrier protein